jgi:hypothetical protein
MPAAISSDAVPCGIPSGCPLHGIDSCGGQRTLSAGAASVVVVVIVVAGCDCELPLPQLLLLELLLAGWLGAWSAMVVEVAAQVYLSTTLDDSGTFTIKPRFRVDIDHNLSNEASKPTP